jgi:hypothetical protein
MLTLSITIKNVPPSISNTEHDSTKASGIIFLVSAFSVMLNVVILSVVAPCHRQEIEDDGMCPLMLGQVFSPFKSHKISSL